MKLSARLVHSFSKNEELVETYPTDEHLVIITTKGVYIVPFAAHAEISAVTCFPKPKA